MKSLVEAWRAFWSDLQYVVVVLIVVVFAFGCFLMAYKVVGVHPTVAKVLEKIGDLAITGLVLQMIMRFWAARRAEAVFFERLKVRDSVVKAGFREFFWFDRVPWEELFRESVEVEVFAITARMLTGEKIGITRAFLKRPGVKLTVIIHDPDDADAMAQYDKKFGERSGTRREKILQHIQDLQRLAGEEGVAGKLEIRLSRATPSYTYYRFDNKILYVPYLIKPNVRIPEHIPAFMFSEGDVAEKFLRMDLAYVNQESRVIPAGATAT